MDVDYERKERKTSAIKYRDILDEELIYNLYNIADHYGLEHQLNKLQEELGELSEALEIGDQRNIEEEICDVNIMIAQVVYLMHKKEACFSDSGEDIFDTLKNICEYKIFRQLKRIIKELVAEKLG